MTDRIDGKKTKKSGKKDKRKSFFINDCSSAIYRLIQEILNNGTKVEGIMRISGPVKQVETIKKAMLKGNNIDLSKYEIHSVAGALKQILRDLQEPLLLSSNYDHLITAIQFEDPQKTLSILRAIVRNLPQINSDILDQLIKLSIKIKENESFTKMTTHNLAIVLGPTILRKDNQTQEEMLNDSLHVIKVADHLITSYDYLFGITDVITISNPVQLNEDELSKIAEQDNVEENKRAYLIRLASKAKELDNRLSKEVGDKVILQSLLMHQSEDTERLRSDFEKVEAELKEAKLLEKKYLEEIDALKAKLANVDNTSPSKNASKDYENEVNALKSKITEAERKLDLKDKEAASYKKKYEDKEKEAIELKKKLDEREKEIDLLRKNAGDKDKADDILKKRLDEKDQEIKDLSKKLELKTKEFLQASKSLEESQATIKKQADEISTLKSTNQRIEKELNKERTDRSTAVKESESLTKQLNQLKQSMNDKEKKIKQLEDDNKKLSNTIKDNEKKALDLDNKVKELTKKVTESSNLNKKVQTSDKEIENLKLLNKQQEEKIKKLETDYSEKIKSHLQEEEELKSQLFSYMTLSIKLDAILSNQSVLFDTHSILDEIKSKNINWRDWSTHVNKYVYINNS